MGTSQKVLDAVADPEWQKFRQSLKGTSTQYKLKELLQYLKDNNDSEERNKVYLRVDNYLKALARGGQIAPEGTNEYIGKLRDGKLRVRK